MQLLLLHDRYGIGPWMRRRMHTHVGQCICLPCTGAGAVINAYFRGDSMYSLVSCTIEKISQVLCCKSDSHLLSIQYMCVVGRVHRNHLDAIWLCIWRFVPHFITLVSAKTEMFIGVGFHCHPVIVQENNSLRDMLLGWNFCEWCVYCGV